MAAPSNIRQINRRDVLNLLVKTKASTRSDLARATGLSQPTMGKIVDDLIDEGLLMQADAAAGNSSRVGRPGHDIMFNRTTPHFLALQLGVVHTRLTPLTVAPPTQDRWEQEFVTAKSMQAWLKTTVTVARKMLKPSMRAVLVSVPGVLDESDGRSILSPNLRWLEGQHITGILSEKLRVPVFAVQELRCLALGHSAIDPESESFLLVDFGNGLGSAPIVRGRLLQSELPLSGELGHTPVAGNKLKCGCGGVGCLETLVSRQRLLHTAGIHTADWHKRWSHYLSKLKPNALPTKLSEALDATALGIAGALNVLGLDRVIVTGYLSELPDHAMRVLHARVQAAAISGRFGAVTISAAPRRRLAGLASIGLNRVLAHA